MMTARAWVWVAVVAWQTAAASEGPAQEAPPPDVAVEEAASTEAPPPDEGAQAAPSSASPMPAEGGAAAPPTPRAVPRVMATVPTWTPPPLSSELQAAMLARNTFRRRTEIGAMSTLLVWTTANLGVGTAGFFLADNPQWKAFHRMSIGWNVINAAIGIPGLIHALRSDPASMDLRDTLRADRRLQTTFAFNTGLDVGWVMTGAFLWERGLRQDIPELIGAGQSMVMQGAFLLALDTTMLILHGTGAKRFLLSPVLGPQLGVRAEALLGGPSQRRRKR